MPVLNEESTIGGSLPVLVQEADQVIVSDGGSRDRTRELAAGHGARVVEGPAGRGRQLNRGAAAASAEVLLFVHADTTLRPGAVERVRDAIRGGAAAGGFYVEWRSERPIMRLGGRLTNLRTRLTGCPLGDQAQFCRSDLFAELGGFREWPLLEDLDFARRLKRAGRVTLLEPPVTTSVRRYQNRGVARTVAINWLIWLLYFAGVAPERLAKLYANVR